uniref:Putative secreted protein n=1 Tax=Xenopsylla cheopis TaxID=163159 RepID=A0A6M2DWA6_XENCH
MYICLEIMLPLFQVLEFAITDPHQNPLQVKVQSCLKNLCNIKKFSSLEGVTEQLLFDLMSSLLNNEATSSINIARNKENAECCTFLVRCSILINADNVDIKNVTPLIELYKSQLIAFFTRRDNHLPVTFFSNVLSIVWSGNWSLLPICLEQAFNPEIRPFRRALALKLLQVFYQNYRSLNSMSKSASKIFKKLETNLSTNISVLVESDEANNHEHFFQQLIILLTLIKKYHKMDKSQASDLMDWDSVQANILKIRPNIKFSLATKSSFNKFCSILNISSKQINAISNGQNIEHVPPSKKQKLDDSIVENVAVENGVDEISEDDDSKPKEKKYKTKAISNEKMKLKKQAKLLRMQAQEGFEAVSFSQMKMNTIESDDENIEDNEVQNNSVEDSEEKNEHKLKKKHKKRKHSVTE